jgi:fucose permease
MIRNVKAITAATYLAMLFLGVGTAIIGAAARNIGLSPAQIGLLLAVQNAGFGVAVLVCGLLGDRYPKPAIVLAGSLILAPGFLFLYRSDLFWINGVIMLAIGLGSGAYEGSTDALMFDLHRARAGLHINVNHFFVTLGSILITLYLLGLQMNWQAAMVQSAVAVFGLALFFALVRVRAQPSGGESLAHRLKVLGRDRRMRFLFVAVLLAVGVEIGAIGILATYLAELRGFTLTTSKLGLVVFLLGMATGRLLIGFLIRRGQLPGYIIALFAASAAMFAVLVGLNLGPLTWPALYLAGLGMSALLPLMLTLAGLSHPDSPGAAMGALKVAIPIGGVLVPFVMALLAANASFALSLAVFPLALLGGLLAFLGSGFRPAAQALPGELTPSD